MAYSAFKKFTMVMCFSSPQASMICSHSAIDVPYFFSIEGKYEAGPCDGQVLVMNVAPIVDYEEAEGATQSGSGLSSTI